MAADTCALLINREIRQDGWGGKQLHMYCYVYCMYSISRRYCIVSNSRVGIDHEKKIDLSDDNVRDVT